MADAKISALTSLTGAGAAQDDLLAIVDTSAATTKKITREEFFKSVDYISFDTTNVVAAPTEGQLTWDTAEKTLSLGLNGGNTVLQLGQETHYRVRNNTGAQIPDGTVVRFSGVLGSSGIITVAPALADGTYPSSYIIGVTTENISHGADGLVAAFGKVRGIDTSAFAVGDILYASPTVAGGFTKTRPSGSQNIVSVAAVLSSGVNNGIVFVRPHVEEENQNFATRASLVSAIFNGFIPVNGETYFAGGLSYLGKIGATTIPDLPGLIPNGDVTPDHWRENTIPGTTDMTPAIQSALTYVGSVTGGGTVKLRDSVYFVSSTITISTNDTNLVGGGETATEIRRSGDYGHTIVVTGNDTTGVMVQRNSISGIMFRSLGLTTSGAHILWNGTFISQMQNIYFENGFIAVQFSGATNVHVESVRAVWSNLYSGAVAGRRFFLFNSASATYGHPSSGDVFIDSFNIRTNGSVPNVEVGVEIQSADGIWFQNGHYGGASLANLWFNAVDANEQIGLVFHDNVMLDANEGDGIRFSGSAQTGRNIYFYGCNCKGGALGKIGFNVQSGASYQNVQWGGGFISEFNEHGVFINSANFKNADFSDAQIRGNSYTTTNTYDGVNINAGDTIRFTDCSIGGGNVLTTAKTQRYGVVIGANASNTTVSNVDLSNNMTAPSLVNGLAVNARLVNCRSDASRIVASASSINPPAELDYFTITGTTAMPNMIARPSGSRVTLRFEDAVTIAGSGNIKVPGATVTRAGQVMTFVSDGTNWHPMAGSEILSSGENANGRWVRYANGWQVCSSRLTINAAISVAMVGGFRNTGQTWTYPQAFKIGELPVVTAIPGSLASMSVVVTTATNTATSVFHTSVTSQAAADLVAHVKVEGWWL